MTTSQNTKLRTILSTSLDPSNLPSKPAAGQQHILGLHFPPSSHAPQPIWIPLSSSTDEETSITFQSVDVSSIFPPDIHPEVLYSDQNPVRHRETESMLEIWTLAPSVPSAGPNGCVADLLELSSGYGGKRRGTKDWRGPVLALAMTRATGFMVDPGSYKDITLGDAEDVVDFLASHGGEIRGAGFWDGVEENGVRDRVRTNKDEDGLKMKCNCGKTADDGNNVIHCAGCDTWQHMGCYYPGEGKKMRFDHLCADCRAGKAAQDTGDESKQIEDKQTVFEVL